jgi:DNA-binding XRE family transcriptional regulator
MGSAGKHKKPVTAGKVLDRMIGNDRALRARIDEQMLNLHVAEMLYEARTAAGLSQTELAKLVGTTQSVISKLEDADYEGHSLSMLKRIGAALHKDVEVHFVPESRGGVATAAVRSAGVRSSPVRKPKQRMKGSVVSARVRHSPRLSGQRRNGAKGS